MQTESLFELTYILLEKKQVTAAEMAEHFGVSQRTIYRWVDALNLAGVPIYAIKGKGGGLCLSEKYALDKTVFTEDEKLELLAGVQALENLSGNKQSAITKLKSLTKANADWIEVDFAPWNPKLTEIKNIFNLLKTAVLSERKVRLDYYSSNGNCANRILCPWKIVFRGQAWYLWAWCEQKKENRFFKLSRMKNVEILSEKSESNLKINSNASQIDYSGYREDTAPKITLKLRVHNQDIYRILDDFCADKVQDDTPLSKILTLTVPKMPWLTDWLLSFGSRLEILSPVSIKKQLKEEIKKMAAKF